MKAVTQFNTSVIGFVNDLKKMNLYKNEVSKLETYIEIIHINAWDDFMVIPGS